MRKRISVLIAAIAILWGLAVVTGVASQFPSGQKENSASRRAQAGGLGDGQQAQRTRPQPVTGTVTTVGVDQLQIKTRDGKTVTVKVRDTTRFRDGQREIQLEDVKPGDHAVVMGQASGPEEMIGFMVRNGAAGQMAAFQKGDRTLGRIVSINGNEVSIENPFQGQQVVEVTNQTEFSRDGQTITLKDLKIGDGMMAIGERKNGKFVAQRVFTGNMRRGGQGRGSPAGFRQ